MNDSVKRCLGLAGLLLLASSELLSQPLGTAFTYQGRLTESNQPATGLYDLKICLFDSLANPVPIACAPDFDDVPVEDGVFSLALDFGATPFVGQQRFLELQVRPGASAGGYTMLAPRQLIRPAPEALRATVSGATPWSGLTGVPAGFADGIDNDSGGTVTSVAAGTGMSGGTITGSGTLGIADGGVDTAQLAAGAVGATQIDPAQVQARITGTCAIGEYFRGINVDGSVACEPMPGVPRITAVDDPANVVGQFTSIAIGADGLPVISYYDATADALIVARCSNAACIGAATVTTVDDPANNVGEHTSIVIGADGLPVISYRDSTAFALKVAKCGNAACTGAATITTVDDPANTVGEYTSIAIGADGLPVISYYDTTADALKVAKCGNAACTGAATITTVDDPANSVGEYTSIAIGADGLPVISYYDTTADALKVAKCSTAACTGAATITTVDDPANNVGLYTRIAIGADGRPVIGYRDSTAGALKVAKCSNAACTGAIITTVDDPANNVGGFLSIAVGADGLPVISYFDFTGALKVARCADAACSGAASITTVDNPANDVGQFTSIAIGADGLPVISYWDSTAGALKVAKCGTRSCQ
jgi:predicted regulator of Ras-like GTPase activity (Roadblock/LC7/MglB family)